MDVMKALRSFFTLDVQSWGADLVTLATPDDEIAALFGRAAGSTVRTYRLPSVAEAMSVPSIQSAVALISGTVGMLSVQGYRNGSLMTDAPRLISRPDPYQTPQAFYSGTAANIAKYGESVWWIASRDSLDFASALINVPLHELEVTENLNNRLRPDYRWGTRIGTRWTAATPQGRFVHIMYPTGEPLALRGSGPLQLCRAAVSVSVEAQAWAAQFYADGGDPSVLIKHAAELSPELDEDGLSEADRLRAQWVSRPHNVPRIIDQNIESVEYKDVNPNGAQMLDARSHQDGDSARMFRIPGPLLEYQQSGGSLTYQNRTDLKGELVETCLQPLYLEPIEQAMSDLLPRSIVARFNVKGFLRADAKTRFEVHGIAIDKGIYDSAYAQREEGILPGDVEFAPVPFSPPSAVPGPLPRYASMATGDVRCDGQVLKKQLGVSSFTTCDKLLTRDGRAYIGTCPRCKKVYSDAVPPPVPDTNRELTAAIVALASRPEPIPAPVTVTIEEGAVQVHMTTPAPPVPTAPEAPVLGQRMRYDDAGRLVQVIDLHVVPEEETA